MIRSLLLILFCYFSSSLFAQKEKESDKSKQGKFTRYGLIMDQDLLAEMYGLKNANEDRNYTMGLGLFITNERWGEAKLFRPFKWIAHKTYCGWAKKMFNDADYIPTHSATISMGVAGFTPLYLGDNITDSLYYMLNDRPFSSLTFLSVKYQTGTRKKVETNQVVFGLLGLGVGGDVQTYIHENHWFGSTRQIPYGWKYQKFDGGRLTVLLSNRTDILLNERSSFREERLGKMNTQFIASREYRVGYYTSASAGIAMRIGILDPNNWTAYDSYQLGFAAQKTPMAKLDKPSDNTTAIKTSGTAARVQKIETAAIPIMEEPRELRGELYFQAMLRPQLMLYNQHIQGGGNKLNYTYHVNHFIVEGLAGVGGTIPNARKNFSVGLFAYVSGRTAEIKSAVSNRTHIWGGLQVSFSRVKP